MLAAQLGVDLCLLLAACFVCAGILRHREPAAERVGKALRMDCSAADRIVLTPSRGLLFDAGSVDGDSTRRRSGSGPAGAGGLAGYPPRQDSAISLNPSPSGSLRTRQGVSKYMVARSSAV